MGWLFDRYEQVIVDTGKQPLYLLLVGLLAAFLFIRTSTRLIRAGVSWWPGNVSAGPVHLHHELFGVLLMLATGIPSFTVHVGPPWRDLLALGFGIGAGLVLDEFALLLHLRDVYWSREGRSSLGAVVVVSAGTLLLLLGVVPLGLGGISDQERSARWILTGIAVVNLVAVVVCALKGKVWVALIGIVVPVVGLVGAVRLARPDSPWARWRYARRPVRAGRAAVREQRWSRRRHFVYDLVAGAPTAAPDEDARPPAPRGGG